MLRPFAILYLTLTPDQKQELIAGKVFSYSTENNPNGLPPNAIEAIFDGFRDVRPFHSGNSSGFTRNSDVTAEPVTNASDAYATFTMRLTRDKAGKYKMIAHHNVQVPSLHFNTSGNFDDNSIAPPMQTASQANPTNNARANAALAADAQMQKQIAFAIKPMYATNVSAPIFLPPAPAATSADLAEAVFNATQTDVIADAFTGFFLLSYLKTQPLSLFDALCFNGDRMGLRWKRDGGWLTFRQVNFFDRRADQVPNRLLERWAASRREHGTATLDDILEIAQLPPLQSQSQQAATQACVQYGLMEWALVQNENLRPHWEFLAQLTPDLRRLAAAPQGLPFARLPLKLRPAFIQLASANLTASLQPGLPEFINATLRVFYTPAHPAKAVPVEPQPSEESRPPLPPQPIAPDWKIRFTYAFGSKRIGQWRHNIRPDGFNFDEPGEINTEKP